jgi:hypothetical protein
VIIATTPRADGIQSATVAKGCELNRFRSGNLTPLLLDRVHFEGTFKAGQFVSWDPSNLNTNPSCLPLLFLARVLFRPGGSISREVCAPNLGFVEDDVPSVHASRSVEQG